MEEKNFITLRGDFVIEERLKELSDEIDIKIETANAMVCTEESKSEVKKMRTSLKKDFEVLETQRKAVKTKVLEKYNAFEELYKKYVTEKFKIADKSLGEKINIIEDAQKKELEDTARDYFAEYASSKDIDFVSFERMGLKIGVSDNDTKLRKQIVIFLDKISEDLRLIETQENKEEILVEYKQSLNVIDSINKVKTRIKMIEEEKRRQEELLKKRELEQEAIAKVEAVIEESLEAPVVVESKPAEPTTEPVYTMSFYVRGTKEELKAVKAFLEEGNYEYGSIN
jgi:hypothetical protein